MAGPFPPASYGYPQPPAGSTQGNPLRLIKATAALQNPAQMPQHMAAQQMGAGEAPMGAGQPKLPPWLTTTAPAQQQPMGAQGPQYPRGAEPWYEDLSEGAVSSILSVANMPLDVAGVRNEKLTKLEEDWTADSEQSPWGLVGQAAVPLAAALKGVRLYKTLKKAGLNKGKGVLSKTIKYIKDEIDGAGVGTAAQSKKGRRS